MTAEEYDALKEDISKNGQQVPIIKQGDTILDGRHRYEACQELEIVPRIAEWEGEGSPFAFIASMNLHRRHLSESQRGLIAAQMKSRRVTFAGGQTIDESGEKSELTFTEAAAVMQVGERTVRDAKLVLEKGTEREVEAVRQGEAAASNVAAAIRKDGNPTRGRSQAKGGPAEQGDADAPDRGRPAPTDAGEEIHAGDGADRPREGRHHRLCVHAAGRKRCRCHGPRLRRQAVRRRADV
jgi:hypothetical protein